MFFLSTIVSIVTKQSVGGILTERDSQISLQGLKPGRFYLLPKIHKANNPGRPIVSANGHPTEKISEFVNFHLRQHVEALRT
jgi:hypothetical protein